MKRVIIVFYRNNILMSFLVSFWKFLCGQGRRQPLIPGLVRELCINMSSFYLSFT